MKMRLAVLFIFWIALVWPLYCAAETDDELIEVLSSGQMNWTRSLIVAKGRAAGQNASQSTKIPEQLVRMGQQDAKANILQALGEVRIDAHRHLSAVFAENNTFATKVAEMVDAADQVHQKQLSDGSIEVTMQFSLLGGFSQLILPQEIEQVEPIKAINSPVATRQNPSSMDLPVDTNGYSGLIVDARGIGARPALVPILVDESGQEVYSPAFVSREYAVQKGVCEYTRTVDGIENFPRVRPKPLLVKGLRTRGSHPCDIVISNADAFKLRDASTNLHFLKQCRVIIVLD